MTEKCCMCSAAIDIVIVEHYDILHGHLVCDECSGMYIGKVEVTL